MAFVVRGVVWTWGIGGGRLSFYETRRVGVFCEGDSTFLPVNLAEWNRMTFRLAGVTMRTHLIAVAQLLGPVPTK
jgi:hypothetical protein